MPNQHTTDKLKQIDCEEDSDFLTRNQKQFCRLFVLYEENYQKAAQEVYVDQKNPNNYGCRLLMRPQIKTYIEFLRDDVYQVTNKHGKFINTIKCRVDEYNERIAEAANANNYQAVSSMMSQRDQLVGKRRKHSIDLTHYKTPERKLQALYRSLTAEEIDIEEFNILYKSVKSDDVTNTAVIRAVLMPDNDRINDDSKKGEK